MSVSANSVRLLSARVAAYGCLAQAWQELLTLVNGMRAAARAVISALMFSWLQENVATEPMHRTLFA